MTKSKAKNGPGKPLRSTLKKDEILRGFRSFSTVLSSGECLRSGSIRCFFLLNPGEPTGAGVRAGFGVSRTIRKATARNRLRRLMREAYRLNKGNFLARQSALSQGSIQLVFMFVPGAEGRKANQTHESIKRAIISLLEDLHRRLARRQ